MEELHLPEGVGDFGNGCQRFTGETMDVVEGDGVGTVAEDAGKGGQRDARIVRDRDSVFDRLEVVSKVRNLELYSEIL